jgi:hypothetical protein
MSILSNLGTTFTNYLYNNDLKIQTVESSDKKNISGFWSFLHNSKKGYISQIHYHIFRKNNSLYSSLHINLRNIRDIKNTLISSIILLYFLTIYGDSYDIDTITILDDVEDDVEDDVDDDVEDDVEDDVDDDVEDKNNNENKECFLCKTYGNYCVICDCEKDNICPISKIIELYTGDNKDKYILSFRDLKNTMFPYRDNSVSFIRNYLKKNSYYIDSQEHIDYINCNCDINAYISIKKGKYDKNIYFTFTEDKNTINKLNIIVREDDDNNNDNENSEDIKLVILHLTSSYSYSYSNKTYITISFHQKNKEFRNFFLNSGFTLSNKNDKLKKQDFFGLEIDMPSFTLINYI